ncbi:hypothetical protein [Flavobacterium hibisci]|uniref:hypothetical protein n=1 Tax=Flavobacterium hibisci TaxID=1914462 RepID=UPI001CBB450B|nr:hypothetical protein [Flavobacterium hibisci]MBZ4042435.1 hypothetical protein [Flavobacterium hibisci]
MKKKLLNIFIFLTVIILIVFIWINLPYTITRYSDIKRGEKIIQNVLAYKVKNGLPNNDDWKVLEKLGFENKIDYLQPDYIKLNNETFEIIYLNGLDSPFLKWNSKEKVWKMGNPSKYK